MKKIILIVLIVVIALAGIGVTVALVVANQPENIVGRTLMNFADDLLDRKELGAVVDALDEGSLELKVENNGANHNLPMDFAAGGKLYFSDDALMAEHVYVSSNQKELVFNAYLSEDRMYVQNNDLLNGTWGLERGQTVEQFEDSAFAYGSGSALAIEDEEISQTVSEILKLYDDGTDKEFTKDLKNVLERYTDKAWALFCENAVFVKEEEEVRVSGQRVTGRVITITVDDKAMENILLGLLDYWAEDEELEELVFEYSDILSNVSDNITGNSGDDDFKKLYTELLDQKKDAEKAISEMLDEMDDEVIIKVYTAKSSTQLLKLEVAYGREELFLLDVGPNGVKNAQQIEVVMGSETYTYEIRKNDATTFRSRLIYKSAWTNDKDTLFTIDVNREEQTYEIDILDDLVCKGTLVSSNGVTTITLEEFYEENRGDTLGLTMTVILKDDDDMPAPEKALSSVFTIDEQTLEGWVNNWKENYLSMFEIRLPEAYLSEDGGILFDQRGLNG